MQLNPKLHKHRL